MDLAVPQRQLDAEGRPLPLRALDRDGPAVGVHDRLDHGQAQADAGRLMVGGAGGAKEALERPALLAGGDSGAGVGHLHDRARRSSRAARRPGRRRA